MGNEAVFGVFLLGNVIGKTVGADWKRRAWARMELSRLGEVVFGLVWDGFLSPGLAYHVLQAGVVLFSF